MYHQEWMIPGGGSFVVKVSTKDPIPVDVLVKLEPIIRRIEEWVDALQPEPEKKKKEDR